jgi:hypothetical protein
MSSESRSDRFARWLVPSLDAILVFIAILNAFLFRRGSLFAFDGDVGRHVRVGRTILEQHAIPRVDLFSHTRAGTPFVPYEWLSEVITAGAHGIAGLPGVVVLSALLYAVAVLSVYRTADELGAPRLLGFFVALLALLLQSVHLLPRPHLFTTALAGVFVIALVRFARTGRAWSLAPLPPLMVFWANAHGGFLIGFVLLGAFLVGALLRSREFVQRRRAAKLLGITMGLCVLASLINPAGAALWKHTIGYLGIDFLVAATHEYQSVDFHQGYGKFFYLVLMAGPVLWMTGRVRVSWIGAGLYLFFSAAALHSARNIPLFTVAALPWLAIWLRDFLKQGGERSRQLLRTFERLELLDRSLRPGLSVLLILLLIGACLGPWAEDYRFDPTVFPVTALDSDFDTSGNVLNEMAWGGYLLLERPDVPVFIDGQTDFYGEELSRDYLAVIKARQGWREVLDAYDIAWTFTRRWEPINQLLALDPDWRRAYEDDVAVVYRRVGPR